MRALDNIIKPLWICFFLFLTPLLSRAELKQWPAGELKSILIQAEKLKIKFQASKSGFYTLKAGGESFSFKNKEGRLEIQSKGFASKKRWSESQDKLELSFSGPSLPAMVFASSAELSFLGWKSPIFISSFKTDVELQNTKGTTQVDFYEGQANIKNHKGDLKLKSFKADFNLRDSHGLFDFQVNKGRLRIKNSGGRLDFAGNELDLRINDFNGDIKGFTESGELRAFLKPKRLELKTGVAPVRVYVKGQGPRVEAFTQEGYIYAPKYLFKKFEGKSIRVSGRIRSSEKEGHLKLETESGKIYIN